jgi:hypothetical protein
MLRPITSVALLACFVSLCQAEKNASIAPKLATVGSPVVEESFDEMSKVMAGVKGEWKVVDGVLTGKELKSDKHAAVLNFQKKNHNSVVRFSFKFDDKTKGLHFSLNHPKGHLFRVVVDSSQLKLQLDKDKKDPKSKSMSLGTAKGKFEQGQWYTMQVEMVGDQVVAQTDNGAIVEGSHARLDTPKPNYRFVMRGETLSIDDLHIWDIK